MGYTKVDEPTGGALDDVDPGNMLGVHDRLRSTGSVRSGSFDQSLNGDAARRVTFIRDALGVGLPEVAVMATRTLLTFEQFQKYPGDGQKHELLQGEHVTLPPPKFNHSRIQHNLLDALRPYVRQRQLGDVMLETGFRLSSDTWLQPDVSFVRRDHIKNVAPDGYLDGAPALAIEVASDSNTAAQLDLKMELYFAHGAEEVWVVYPQTRRVRAHFPDGHSETLGADLQSALFPGWTAPLADVFTA